jgi:hypothetical protein
MTTQTGNTGCMWSNNSAAEIQFLPHSKHDLFLKGKIVVCFANNTEKHKRSVKECRVIVVLIRMVYAVYSNYSSNRVKWLPGAPAPRSTGLWTERVIKEWTSATKCRRWSCFCGKKISQFEVLSDITHCQWGPNVAVNVCKTWGHAGKRNCTICTNRKLTVIVLGTPPCPTVQHCPHTVSRTAFTAQSMSVCTMSAQRTNSAFKNKWNVGQKGYEIIKRKAKKQERIRSQRIKQSEKNKWHRQTRKLNK